MARRDLLGAWGEATAAAYLRRQRCEILECNYRCRFGEIDLIARDGKYLVFAEVKLRASDRFAEAKEFVDARKQERLRATALLYLSLNESALQPRFDVIEIYAPDGMKTKNPVIRRTENAF